MVELQMAFGSYEVGVIQRTPVPDVSKADEATLSRLARRAWSLKRALDTTRETSRAFVLPVSLIRRLRVDGGDASAIEAEIATIRRETDNAVFLLYNLDGDDRTAIEAWSGAIPATKTVAYAEAGIEATDAGDPDADEADDSAVLDDADALLSWAVGVAFGRFDHRLATGERAIPPEPEPFDPLPPRSPGMLPPDLPPFRKGTGILTDDPGHPDDLAAAVSAVFDLVKEPAPEHLRRTLARDFFPAHLKTYSKSRRKAPIYWQLATPSASYSVWLYLHAMTRDTFYQVQNEVVAPKLAHEERRLETMRSDHGPSPTAAQRKELTAQQTLVEELRAFLDEVKRIAPLWNPDLDDGVLLNASLLSRLFPQHKPWQKELKATWEALCAGKYDWAHLAMHLFPERVVPKCAEDRSLAIAHDLEDVFWVEDASGKWKPRGTPTRPVDQLVKERTSTAVKSALKSLLDAPQAAGSPRGRGRRATGARADGGGDA
ncbi:type II restriction endonuclease subunit M [Sorangium sp. So ce388]|uniref:type II restriction endonuclease subunit M n=1 Tax=Sorangium sp. So ce388 TaxID=3133309 RepID=UPI003F5C25D3